MYHRQSRLYHRSHGNGQSKEKGRSDGELSRRIRLKKKGVLVYQEAQTFARKQAAQVWVTRRETELAVSGEFAEQADDYGKQRRKGRTQGRQREEAAAAALTHLAEQQNAHRALEACLQDQIKTHRKDMNDAQAQARLRDRLAAVDLLLLVLIDAGALPPRVVTVGCRPPDMASISPSRN